MKPAVLFFLILLSVSQVAALELGREYHLRDNYHQSSVYNSRFGTTFGTNPYHARSSYSSSPRGYINIRNPLDYQVYRNPWLLQPRRYTNYQPDARGLQEGFYRGSLGAVRGTTGVIRTHVQCGLC